MSTILANLKNLTLEDKTFQGPEPYPAGHAILQIRNYETKDVTTKNGPASVLKFMCEIVEGISPEIKGDALRGYRTVVDYEFWLSAGKDDKNDKLGRFFYNALGFPKSNTLGECLDQVQGRRFRALLANKPFARKDGTSGEKLEIKMSEAMPS